MHLFILFFAVNGSIFFFFPWARACSYSAYMMGLAAWSSVAGGGIPMGQRIYRIWQITEHPPEACHTRLPSLGNLGYPAFIPIHHIYPSATPGCVERPQPAQRPQTEEKGVCGGGGAATELAPISLPLHLFHANAHP